MESKIIQDFEGEINGIRFYNQYIFNTTEYLAEEIEKKFGEIDTDRYWINKRSKRSYWNSIWKIRYFFLWFFWKWNYGKFRWS